MLNGLYGLYPVTALYSLHSSLTRPTRLTGALGEKEAEAIAGADTGTKSEDVVVCKQVTNR
jgi:hypothetical protein